MVDNQKEYWKRVLYPPDASGVNSLVEFEQGGVNPIGALIFPIGTTAQRPSSPISGMMRYNTTIGEFEFFNTPSWLTVSGVGGVTLTNLEDADADTQVFVENFSGPDDDTIAMTVGDNSGNFTAGAAVDILSFSTAGFQIDTPDAASGTTAGVSLSFTTGGGNLAGAGGVFALTTGTGGTTGDGGDITINGGQGGATSGAGGSIALTAGSTPVNGAGGTLSLTAGNSGSGVPGGGITLVSGDGNNASGGDVSVTAGTVSSGTASGGDISLTAGAGAAEIGGSVTLTGGSATEATGGAVTIVGGDGDTGGSIVVSTGTGAFTEGTIQLQIDGTEGMTIEVDGTLSVPSLTAGGAAYETQVTDDDDIPNKKYVDDEVAGVSATPPAVSGTYVGSGGPGQIVALGAFVPAGIHIVSTSLGAPPVGITASVLVTSLGAGGVVGVGLILPPEATIAGPTLVLAAGSTVDAGGVVYNFVAWA